MGKKYCFVSTGKILRGHKLKFMFGSVFAYVLVLGGLGEGRGGGREEGLLLLRPHREFSGVTILESLLFIEYTLVPLAGQHLLQLCISSNISF